MLLDILDNLPCLCVSNNLLKMFLWILKECGIPNVPSYEAFQKMQSNLQALCGTKPTLSQSALGNIFYVNNVQESIKRVSWSIIWYVKDSIVDIQDFANPEIAKHIQFYPEEVNGPNPISEVWQAAWWKEFKPSELTPMYSQGYCQFYIKEVSQLKCGNMSFRMIGLYATRFLLQGVLLLLSIWWIPVIIFAPWTPMLISNCLIIFYQDGWIKNSNFEIIPASSFQYNYFDIQMRIGSDIPWKGMPLLYFQFEMSLIKKSQDGTDGPKMPNPLHKIAGDDDLYVVMMPLWCDDVSGNRSKQYNKHINMYMVNLNLPGQLLQQEDFVHFVSTSPHATALEQFTELKVQIK